MPLSLLQIGKIGTILKKKYNKVHVGPETPIIPASFVMNVSKHFGA
jgi:hypothetical protein